jgi:hypothetical protein
MNRLGYCLYLCQDFHKLTGFYVCIFYFLLFWYSPSPFATGWVFIFVRLRTLVTFHFTFYLFLWCPGALRIFLKLFSIGPIFRGFLFTYDAGETLRAGLERKKYQ